MPKGPMVALKRPPKPARPRPKPIIVIGAGMAGVATALHVQNHLQQKQTHGTNKGKDEASQVILFDRVPPATPESSASFGNAGVLSAASIVPILQPKLVWQAPAMLASKQQPLFVKWGYLPRLLPWLLRYLPHATHHHLTKAAAALHPLLHDTLREHQALARLADTGTKSPAAKYIKPCHYIYVYKSRAGFMADNLAWRMRKHYGYGWQEYADADLHRYEPLLAGNHNFAASLPKHGQITSPHDYIQALVAGFVAKGGRFVKSEVSDIVYDKPQQAIKGVRARGRDYEAAQVVVTSGVWTKRLLGRLGIALPLEAESGYHIDLWQPSHLPRNPLFIMHGKMVLSPMAGRLRLAGIVEFGGISDRQSSAPLDLLMHHVKRIIPNLSWQRHTTWLGHRPLLPDSIPVISPVKRVTGLYVAVGHHHIGLSAGAKSGRLLASMVLGETPAIDPTPYAIDRFI
ncbi:MAG: FAD-binding oxidoreductase [Proteobacteria bacterium]|nr:FAD-binding oxidoreductase [Pseudomonadota bacterium]